MENNIKKEKKLIGHNIMRDNEWIKTKMEGMIEGKTGSGKPRISFIKQFIKRIGKITYNNLDTTKLSY